VAEAFKVLGQQDISTSAFGTTLYVVPTNPSASFGGRDISQTLVSSLVVCNRHASNAGAYSVRVIPNGESEGNKHTIFLDTAIAAKDTHVISLGLGMQAGDTIKVSGSTGDTISMSAFGIEMV
jgi:hypothetical protein